MRKLVFALWIAAIGMIWLGAAVAPTPIQAQDRTETLVEIRAQLAQLAGEISALRAEMLASGEAGLQVAGGSALDRMNAIEAELVRLTGRTEALGNRID